ncbi:MAG: hypothetical protein M3Q81_00510 [bacterium]|nr:hypothetical protein [bacterium]
MNDTAPQPTVTNSYVDDYAPPGATQAAVVSPPAMPPTSESSNDSIDESLEAQNIFFLLGVTDGTEEEKESFLDELQQVIWEDFLEKDVELLLTDTEGVELKKIMDNPQNLGDSELQEAIVVYLEKLIPDLEEIMLEKALELKEELFRERIAAMKEQSADQPAVTDTLTQAESLLSENKWRQAAEQLNSQTSSS